MIFAGVVLVGLGVVVVVRREVYYGTFARWIRWGQRPYWEARVIPLGLAATLAALGALCFWFAFGGR
jgi:hypothetical protein